MSKMKKKVKNKQPMMRLSILAASLMMLTPLAYSENTAFSDKPLVGVKETFAPHVVLALSVEFPTAGAAYSAKTEFSFAANDHTKPYRGYFDNRKCYKYNDTQGYFLPSSMAQNSSAGWGQCNNNGATDEFSGNLLNYMTMSALDIFRSSMTGGNRATGMPEITGTTPQDKAAKQAAALAHTYLQGDTKETTFLRRANVVQGQNALPYLRFGTRTLKIRSSDIATAKHYVPHQYLTGSTGDAGRTPAQLGYKVVNNARGYYMRVVVNNNTGTGQIIGETVDRKESEPVGAKDEFVVGQGENYDLVFNNFDFKFSVSKTRQLYLNESRPEFNDIRLRYGKPEGVLYTYTPESFTDNNPDRKTYMGRVSIGEFNAVVKVCDSSVGLEDNCVRQKSGHYKPEGLLQKYTYEKSMRFATLGYLNREGNAVHGGVLRSRMKKLIGDQGNEWDLDTGILDPNPDKGDADKSTRNLGVSGVSITNSGTINYLNKFGDASGYKTNDPGAELYYTALAYLRGTNIGNAPYQSNLRLLGNDRMVKAYDNFPVIYDWEDPLKRGIDEKQIQCHQNTIIFIGDINTHEDRDLPNFRLPNNYYPQVQFNDKENQIQTAKYLQKIYEDQQDKSLWYDNIGSTNSPGGMAALAYWARVNDIRPDIDGIQNGNNFIIDVVENGEYRPEHNAYYLAAKYGGFRREDQSKDTDTNVADINQKETPVSNRSSWTDDATGESTVPAFKAAPDGGGTPRNYAVANNPDAMVSALEKAMKAGGAISNPTQAATGLSVATGEKLDFSNGKKPLTLQSTYNFEELTGDIIGYETEYAPNPKAGTLFNQTEAWRASTALTQQYHNATGFRNRKLYTINNGTVYDFVNDDANSIFSGITIKNGDASKLRNYIVGSTTDEGNLYRSRSGLMGTVVNSTVMPIVSAKFGKNAPSTNECTYADANYVQNRPTYYAAAANDGVLHVINSKGEPVFGYMTGIALDKLEKFAERNYAHQYLNDGTPVITELCMGMKNDSSRLAKTILLGTAGRGGGSVYALDVTNLSNPGKNVVLWEFSSKDDKDLGLTVSKPVVTKSPDGRPLAIVSSGYNNQSGTGHIYILDMTKSSSQAWVENVNYWKIRLGSSGVGTPFVYDQDNDGVGDKIFVGDLEGKLWQIDRKDDTSVVNWAIPYQSGGASVPLFTPSTMHPITAAPYADTVSGKLMVTVGTGKYFSEADLSKTQQNYAYGFIVDGKNPIDESKLLQQFVNETPVSGSNIDLDSSKLRAYTVTSNQMDDTHQGWRLQLLPGHNIAANALIRQKQAAEFIAARITDDVNLQCRRSGTASYISVDIRTGGLHKRPVFDTNSDGQINSSDAPIGVMETAVHTAEGSTFDIISPDGSINTVSALTDGGSKAHLKLANFGATKGVRRISWREIF